MLRARGGGCPLVAIEVTWTEGERRVSWRHDGTLVDREFDVAPVSVAAWQDPPCVVVEDNRISKRVDNAVVLGPRGEERLRLKPPREVGPQHWWKGFYVAYPSDGHLVCVCSPPMSASTGVTPISRQVGCATSPSGAEGAR